MAKQPWLVKFFSRVYADRESGCWIWLGGYTSGGYALLSQGHSRHILAHRFAWTEVAKRDIPDDLVLDHKCCNPGCVNPEHLRVVTQRVNVLRGYSPIAINARKVVCIRGHALTPDNIYQEKDGSHRICRQCKLDSQTATYAADHRKSQRES